MHITSFCLYLFAVSRLGTVQKGVKRKSKERRSYKRRRNTVECEANLHIPEGGAQSESYGQEKLVDKRDEEQEKNEKAN